VLAEGEYGSKGASFGTEAEVAKRAQEDRMNRIYTEPLGKLLELEYINLGRNRISKLPMCIGAFKSLRYLSADWNSLVELPDSIGDLLMLEEISVAFNKLEKLPTTMGACTCLCKLGLHCNRLSQLTKIIGNWTNLEILRLEGNALTSLPTAIGNCASLRILNVSDNQLKALPDAVDQLTRLQHLLADGNMLEALPERLGQCVELGEISVNRNDLRILPMSIGFIRKLALLSAADNPRLLYPPASVFSLGVQVVRSFFIRIQASMENFKLNLTHMRMSDFPLGLETNTNLRSLDMSHNELKHIPDVISLLTNLSVVRLQHNRIREIPESIGELQLVTSLHVNHNVLTTLPQSLAKLDRLTDLCIQGNKMVTLPMCIGALMNLRSFSASDNPLKEPPEDIINGKNSSKLTYNYMRGVFDAMASCCMTLEGFGLRSVPDPAIKLSTLDALMLGKNRISSLPDAIGNLRYLRKLSLKQNELVRLNPYLTRLRNLQILTLSDNKLTSFDPVLLDIVSLKTLSMDKNQITSIPERIDKLSNLIALVLSQNPISRLPGQLCKLTALTELRFKETSVRRIPMSLGTLSLLRALDMDAEVMEEPRSEICMAPLPVVMNYFYEFLQCYDTHSINVAGNSIREFPTEFFTFRHHETKMILAYSIVSIDISRNRLSYLPEEFANFESLMRLDLSFNSLHRVPGALVWLTKLEHLNMEGNYHLTRLPLEMGNMKNLREFKLTASRFVTPPQEVLTKVAPNDHHDAHLGLIEYLQLVMRARDSGKISMSRMGLRQFPPEIISATNMCWDYGEVRGIFMTGRGRLDVITEVKFMSTSLLLCVFVSDLAETIGEWSDLV
jgi:Leucine-rich repeat (LRR) protein